MNELQSLVEINIRSPRYYIARTRGVCPHCGMPTDLFALVLPSGHETLDVAEAAEDVAAADAWLFAGQPALIFHVEYLNSDVAARLTSLASSFRVAERDFATEPAWTNHCEACGSPFVDEELFCEPGEAFFPTGEAGAAAIRLLPIEEHLQAAAGGYSFDPNFVHAMSRE